MTKKPRTLNVYQAQFGFHDSVVAAANQAAALRAWGMHRNLFADGEATVTTDPQATEAALANPDVPLRRPVGTTEPFSLNPSLPKAPAGPAKKARSRPKPAARQPKAPPPPDRSSLSAAEAALDALDAAWRTEEEGFRDRRARLDVDERAAKEAMARNRVNAEETLERERRLYRKAGGH